ncbi:hypothetical protein C9374_004574 [Naegleria lovaniensis]|uniref:Transmembrane protein n=1 Tax=Naegleria lovaniensis TaxID=51637 RepID=A0AA88KJH5_NAELO|nr:uncharacterized protein C9374_004574 [Naegleria lovaniensis]KAG2383237.1 hypothetical protein C9374_004574 [Naegleria lovaniensis]
MNPARYPLTEIFQIFVNLTKHQSLTKTEASSQKWSTIGTILSSIGTWIAFGSMAYHYSDIEHRIAEIKMKRNALIQQRNEAKLNENLHDIVNTVNNETDWMKDKLQPLLIPMFSGLTLFLGFYVVGRRQAFKKNLAMMIKERQKQFPNDPLLASMIPSSSSNRTYKPLSAIKVK